MNDSVCTITLKSVLICRMFPLCVLIAYVVAADATVPSDNCRQGRSYHLRQDGGLCFELPPWQHQPVQLEAHLHKLKAVWGNGSYVRRQGVPALVNSEVSRYMDTVLAPFLDTYHRNIQTSYQQLTGKVLRRIKEEMSSAIRRKQEIYTDLTKLADELNVPSMCDAERRAALTLASRHVADMYVCTEQARTSIAKMGNYAEEMIKITQNHMQETVNDSVKNFGDQTRDNNDETTESLQKLSKAAVKLGYELDLSLTNARRHNEQSCTKLTDCTSKVKKKTDDNVAKLKERLYECVYS